LDKFLPFGPDLAAEVLSPTNRIKGIERKFTLYFEHGCELAWLVLPKKKQVRVYRDINSFDLLHESDHLNGDSVLPGFSYPLRDLFKPLC
jgi:Uma2 family endonuclease